MNVYASTVLGCCTPLGIWNLPDEISVRNEIYITEFTIRSIIYIYLKSVLCLWLKELCVRNRRNVQHFQMPCVYSACMYVHFLPFFLVGIFSQNLAWMFSIECMSSLIIYGELHVWHSVILHHTLQASVHVRSTKLRITKIMLSPSKLW